MTFNQELIFSLEDLAAYESRPSRVVNLMLQTGEKPYLPNFFFLSMNHVTHKEMRTGKTRLSQPEQKG